MAGNLKTGFYWVKNDYHTAESEVPELIIGFYSARSDQWAFCGETGLSHRPDIIPIDPNPIKYSPIRNVKN